MGHGTSAFETLNLRPRGFAEAGRALFLITVILERATVTAPRPINRQLPDYAALSIIACSGRRSRPRRGLGIRFRAASTSHNDGRLRAVVAQSRDGNLNTVLAWGYAGYCTAKTHLARLRNSARSYSYDAKLVPGGPAGARDDDTPERCPARAHLPLMRGGMAVDGFL